MGNTESNVTSGVKKQAGVSTQPLYKLVNLKGGGLLVDMMKRAAQNKQYAEIDHAIKTKVRGIPYLDISIRSNVVVVICRWNRFSTIKALANIYRFRALFSTETENGHDTSNCQKYVHLKILTKNLISINICQRWLNESICWIRPLIVKCVGISRNAVPSVNLYSICVYWMHRLCTPIWPKDCWNSIRNW